MVPTDMRMTKPIRTLGIVKHRPPFQGHIAIAHNGLAKVIKAVASMDGMMAFFDDAFFARWAEPDSFIVCIHDVVEAMDLMRPRDFP